MALLTVLLVAIVVDIPLFIYRGFALQVGWRWFITDTFSLSQLSIIQAIGVMMVAGLISGKSSDSNNDDDDDYASMTEKVTKQVINGIAHGVVTPTIFLIFGYVFHLFM